MAFNGTETHSSLIIPISVLCEGSPVAVLLTLTDINRHGNCTDYVILMQLKIIKFYSQYKEVI